MNSIQRIYFLLSNDKRHQAVKLLFLMVAGMLLEALGMGMIIPVVALMTQTGIHDSWAMHWYFSVQFTSYPQSTLIAAAMLIVFLTYLVKNAFLSYLTWRQTQFAFDVQASMSMELFSGYLYQPYTFHLQKNSAHLIRNVVSEVSLFRGILSSALQLISELLVLAGITLLLLFIEPVGTLAISIFISILAGGYHFLTQEKLMYWGRIRQYHDGQRVQHLQQGLSSIRELRLLGKEENFLSRYNMHNKESARAWKMQTVMQNYPRLLFEVLGVSGLVVLVLVMLAQGKEVSSILPVLGVFGAAAFRLMPLVNRVLMSIQIMKSGDAVINMLAAEKALAVPKIERQERVFETKNFTELELRNITFHYPEQAGYALNCVSLKIRHGESVGLIGTSGSGKSTLVDVMLGLLEPSSGILVINGVEMHECLKEWQSMVGYVPQNIYLTDDTLKKNIAFGLEDAQIDESAVERSLRAAQLYDLVAKLPNGLDTHVGERGVRLSGGQRQRIGIARALYYDPEVLVLDEATSALDEATEREVMKAVAALKGSKTLLVVAHRNSAIADCDRIIRLENGKIVQQ